MDLIINIIFLIILSIFFTWLIFFVSDLYRRFKAIRNIINDTRYKDDVDHNLTAKTKLEAIKEITNGFIWW